MKALFFFLCSFISVNSFSQTLFAPDSFHISKVQMLMGKDLITQKEISEGVTGKIEISMEVAVFKDGKSYKGTLQWEIINPGEDVLKEVLSYGVVREEILKTPPSKILASVENNDLRSITFMGWPVVYSKDPTLYCQ